MRFINALLLFGLLLQSTSFSDKGTISGKVTDITNKKPLTGVVVKAISFDTTMQTITNRYGEYHLNPPPDDYKIVFSYFVNDDSIIKDLKISEDTNIKLNIEIEPNISPQFPNYSYKT